MNVAAGGEKRSKLKKACLIGCGGYLGLSLLGLVLWAIVGRKEQAPRKEEAGLAERKAGATSMPGGGRGSAELGAVVGEARKALAAGDISGAVVHLKKVAGLPPGPGREDATWLLERCQKHLAEGGAIRLPPYKGFRVVELTSPLRFQSVSSWRRAFPHHFGSNPFRPIGARDKRHRKLPLIKRGGMCVGRALPNGSHKSPGSYTLYLSDDHVVQFFRLQTFKGESFEALKLGDYPRRLLRLVLPDTVLGREIQEYVSLSLDDGAVLFTASNGFAFAGWDTVSFKLIVLSNQLIRRKPEAPRLGMSIKGLFSKDVVRKYRMNLEGMRPLDAKLTLTDTSPSDYLALGTTRVVMRLGSRMTVDGLKFLYLPPTAKIKTEDALAIIAGNEMYKDFWRIFGVSPESVNLNTAFRQSKPAGLPGSSESMLELGERSLVIQFGGAIDMSRPDRPAEVLSVTISVKR